MAGAILALALGLGLVASFMAATASASGPTPLAPTLFVEDAPFTRNAVVRLWITADWTYASPAAEWRASNTPATTGGVLVDGASVPTGLGDWTLAAGPDGPRTIYAQVRHADGAWSPVASTSLELDTSPSSRLVIDVEPNAALGSTDQPELTDWHTQWATPSDLVYGSASAYDGGASFSVNAGGWGAGFHTEAGPLAVGTYDIPDPHDQDQTDLYVAGVSRAFQVGCHGPGTFTIHDIALTADGDLSMVDADFRLSCWGTAMAGSIRYGSSRDVVAIDQSADVVHFGQVDLGSAPVNRSVTISNAGTIADTLGDAAIEGVSAAEFSIVDDGCSDATLAVGEDCTIELSFAPTVRGNRGAALTIPDGTAKGWRLIRLGGSAFQPVTLGVTIPSLPEFGPAATTVLVTAYPGPSALLWVDGVQILQPVVTTLTGPPRVELAYPVTLGPGSHHVEATFDGGDFYLPADPVAIDVDVGTATALELTTTTDDGVALGESADLIARLSTGGPVSGTLRIRDGAGGPVLASQAVSGSNPSLTHTVTRDLGSHEFSAEFLPGTPDIEAASDAYELIVVAGTRPETLMDPTPLTTWYWQVQSAFSSPTPDVSFECRVDFANWIPCTSPWTYSNGQPGTVTLKVRAILSNGLADRTPATRPWTFDPNLSGIVVIEDGAAYTASASVTLDTPAPAGAPSVTQVGLSNDGTTWTNRTYASSQAWTLPSGNGSKTVWTRWRDAGGHWSTAATDAIVLDTVDPVASAPKHAFGRNATLSAGRLPLLVTWTGSDSRSGVARFHLERQRDGGAWTSRVTPTSPSYSATLEAGHAYRFRVRAIDRAGNVGAWAYGPTFRLSRFGELAGSYAGTWSKATSSLYTGGTARWSSTHGSRVRFTFTGRTFAWLSAVGPTRGQARIYVNGVYKATVDLYSSTQRTQVLAWTGRWSKVAQRTIEIRVVGTVGRPRIDVDGFLVGS